MEKESSIPHQGQPEAALRKLVDSFPVDGTIPVSVTGRAFRDRINLSSIPEVQAVEAAVQFTQKNASAGVSAVASIGAESFVVYHFSTSLKLVRVHSENKCASGTGEFFAQMLQRTNLSMTNAVDLAMQSEPHKVSGRCSVFCKSDCTHALNAGQPVGSVIAGLCQMMAEKIAALVDQGQVHVGRKGQEGKVLAIGGLTRNTAVMKHLHELVPNLALPEYAHSFEALGAACWAMENDTIPFNGLENLIQERMPRYSNLPPLHKSEDLVTFHPSHRSHVDPRADYILGLDVGSTTTKAVLINRSDKSIVAEVYLRTYGNPVEASRNCYRSLQEQVGDSLLISGVGVTGSGRHIAGLHALTDGVLNEIIAHASAAAFFNAEVDTILEIGGQDAKYTHLVNGVACDYAMNEACSAGTGSFLEESAKETLGIDLDKIAPHALRAEHPVNFSDQCAAFISSDLKNAQTDGFELDDIVAGLVYSICMNYDNKVKANRPVGQHIFMQGGVCYNKAVPIAMASLLGKPVTVPPDPGLMGALGVALEVDKRIQLGHLESQSYRLSDLANRPIQYDKSFICPGGPEKCDLGCEISISVINGKRYPFGGKCDLWANKRLKRSIDASAFDHVARREKMVFETFGYSGTVDTSAPTIGMNRSFLLHSYYPFFSTLLGEAGFSLTLPAKLDPAGMRKKSASFCYPAELAHGYFAELLKIEPDHIVLPQVRELAVPGYEADVLEKQTLCVTCQAEPFYLRNAFGDMPNTSKIHNPVFNFWQGLEKERVEFTRFLGTLGVKKIKAQDAFSKATVRQKEFEQQLKVEGRRVLDEIEQDPSSIGIVIFGRSYNALTADANMGIPRKFASRAVHVLPVDFLDVNEFETESWMHWYSGHQLLRAARYVAEHPQLYAVWISNFSCGPDSFLIGWFRKILGTKPGLVLELDNHTADAGVNTRIDAFLDIVHQYRHEAGFIDATTELSPAFAPAHVIPGIDKVRLPQVEVDGEIFDLTHPRVNVLVPPMGELSSGSFASAMKWSGIRSTFSPRPTSDTLQSGRSCTDCKECLPLTLCAGALLEHLETRPPEEITVYFVPRAEGNCRFGQYAPFIEDLIERKKIRNCAVLTLSSQDNYSGMGIEFVKRAVIGVIVSDAMRDIQSAIKVLAVDREAALATFSSLWEELSVALASADEQALELKLRAVAGQLARIERKQSIEDTPRVLLTGEIFVRVDEFSSGYIQDRLADEGIVTLTASLFEWLRYVEWLVNHQVIGDSKPKSLWVKLGDLLVARWQTKRERKIKTILADSGFYHPHFLDMNALIEAGSQYVNPLLTGETILVAGAAIREILDSVSGVISVGPFACLPSRLSESILSTEFTVERKAKLNHIPTQLLAEVDNLPFLSIETDGRPFPPLIESRLEAFVLQVNRVASTMLKYQHQ